MTNSTNELLNRFKEIYQAKVEIIDDREVKINLESKDVLSVLSELKSRGFQHLSIISCVDWIKENKFELVYILFSWETGEKIIVSTKIDRDEAKFVTVKHMWPVARFYEREIHEFFGITFDGNEDMRPLILELWDDKPPLRKDFDPFEYSKKKFPDRTYEKDLVYEAKIFRGETNG